MKEAAEGIIVSCCNNAGLSTKFGRSNAFTIEFEPHVLPLL